jgi:hypothetical protein
MYRMEPAATVKKTMQTTSLVNWRPMAVLSNVSRPPMIHRSKTKRQDGRSPSAASGATIPNPSVALGERNRSGAEWMINDALIHGAAPRP